MDSKELDQRRELAHKEADTLRRDVPRIRLLNEPVPHEPHGPRPRRDAGEPGQDRRLGVDLDPIEAAGADEP